MLAAARCASMMEAPPVSAPAPIVASATVLRGGTTDASGAKI